MHWTITGKQLVLICSMLVFSSGLAAADGGYWKYSHVIEEKNEREEKTQWGMDRVQIKGGSGWSIISHARDLAGGKYGYEAQMSWSGLPEILIPEWEYTLPINVTMSRYFKPVTHHWAAGGGLIVLALRQALANIDETAQGILYRSAITAGSVSVHVSTHCGCCKDKPSSDAGVASFTPPRPTGDHLDGYAVLITSIAGNHSRRLIYIYRWQAGAPTDEALTAIITDDDNAPPHIPFDEQPARLTFIHGTVMVLRSGAGEWVDAEIGPIHPGDHVLTEEGAFAEVTLACGTIVRLRPASDVQFLPLQAEQEQSIGLLSIRTGRIYVRAVADEALKVQTFHAVANVTGTVFGVKVNPNGSETFELLQGGLTVIPEGRGRQTTLSPGQNAAFGPRGNWIGVGDMTAIEMAEGWIAARPDMSEALVEDAEREGAQVWSKSEGDWQLAIYKNDQRHHGILLFDGLAVREVEAESLASPFGILHYHGSFDPAGQADSGWLTETITDEEPAGETPATPDAPPPPPPAGEHVGEHITLAKNEFGIGQPIHVSWHNLPGNAGDWIAVVPANSPDNTWGDWWYTRNHRSGTRRINIMTAGEYEVRVYFDWPAGGYTVQSRLRFTVR